MWINPVRRSFTLVELLTVVVIITLILGIALPGFTSMWEERKVAQGITLLHGVLTSTRAKAACGSERGLFFYVDATTRRQMIISIVPDPPDDDPASHEYVVDCATEITPPDDPITDCISHPMTEHRFRTIEGDVYELPAPVRVAPRTLLLLDEDGVPLWEDEDIAHERFNLPAPQAGWPRHRNFFTLIFGPDGRLIADRDVIIHDTALRNPTGGGHFNPRNGYRTKLPVGDPAEYYTNRNPADPTETVDFDPQDDRSLYDIIISAGTAKDKAINFISVDGLLIYDDNTLADTPYVVGQDFKRRYLLENAQPLYVSRLTGEVLQGPRGENE